MDREGTSRLVGRRVAVMLKSVEASGGEIIATLDEARDDGVVLSEVDDLGPGPTVFCPWDSLHRVRERPPGLGPHSEEPAPEEGMPEGPWPGEAYYLRGSEEEASVPPRNRMEPSARTLERVVPVGEKRSVGDVAVALTSLELYGEGVGVLRWRVSLGKEEPFGEPDLGLGIPEPVFGIRDDAGRDLPWMPRGGGASNGESHGEVEVRDLPEEGELEVVVVRLTADAYGPEGDYLGEGASLDGPWDFCISLR